MAGLALVIPLTGICGHALGFLVPAGGASQRRIKLKFHEGAPGSRVSFLGHVVNPKVSPSGRKNAKN